MHVYIKSPDLPPKTLFLQTPTLEADLAAVCHYLGFEIIEHRRQCSVECDGRFDVLALENIRGWQALESVLRRVHSEHIDGEQVSIFQLASLFRINFLAFLFSMFRFVSLRFFHFR